MRIAMLRLMMLALLCVPLVSHALADLEANTPAIVELKQSMQQRHSQLLLHYNSGAIGLTHDGLIALRDINAVPLAARQSISALVTAENQDRNALYKEIARANDRPEWESNIRATFSKRWISLAKSGWWYQQADGSWQKK